METNKVLRLALAAFLGAGICCGLFSATADAGVSAGAKGLSTRRSGTGLVATKEEMQAEAEANEEERIAEENMRILGRGALRGLYRSLGERYEVPGFMSVRLNRSLGTIVGPDAVDSFGYPINSTVYIRWRSTTRPEVGELYAVYTPTVVLQNRHDYTDFKVRLNTAEAKSDLGKFEHAGYLYESNGTVEIVDVSRGIVKARVANNRSRITMRDQIMAPLPMQANISPLESPIRMTAAIVAGSPYENLSTSLGSFIYLNRGKRDGVKEGMVFQTLEPVNLIDAPPIRATGDLGEAMVVYASDAFSTAVITKQFNAIRIGSLLETARPGLNREQQANLLSARGGSHATPQPENSDHLSELDKIEKDSDILSLSPEERARLERLHQQELKRRRAGDAFPNVGESAALPGPAIEEEGGSPKLPAPPSISASRKQREEARKKRLRQRQEELRNRDEEDLNKLFSE